jgi:hypothetical protein
MKNSLSGRARLLSVVGLAALQAVLGGALPASAAPGDIVADVDTPEGEMVPQWAVAKAVAFDGQHLYYAEYAGDVLHRIDMPPPGASFAAGHIDIPIVGAPSGIMTIAYDRGRDTFWAVSGDGTEIYLLSKTGIATRQFTVDTVNGLPGNCNQEGGCSMEVKIAYDRTDDTIWYSPDTTSRVYHFKTVGDLMGQAVPVASTPYVDVNISGNDFSPQCGYSYVSGIATGGADLFFENSSCNVYFEYSKTGAKIGAIQLASTITPSGGLTCDNLTYGASVIWMRDGWNPHIYAIEQPSANACVYGGG